MGTEIELKLVASRNGLQKVMKLPWLKKLAGDKIHRQRLRSVYFDTEDSALRRNGVSLRVRSADGRRLQTIKAGSAQPIGRAEWEQEIDRDRPRLELARKTALAPLLVDGLGDKIRPMFETDVERVVMPLHMGRSDVELAFDTGRVATTDASIGICEIEIELKAGERHELVRLAQKMARAAPLALGARAKADWGYALREGTIDAPMSAEPVTIAREQSCADAFVAIGFACLRQIAGNEFAVCRGDGEGIHQMRVGLRRLRAALSLFKEMLHGKELDRIKRELKWLTEQLGPARDSDVLLARTIGLYRTRHPDRHEFEALARDLDEERRAGFALARTAVDSGRFRRLLLDCALWLLDGDWQGDDDPLRIAARQRPTRSFARDEMERRTRKIVKRARKLERLDVRRRHKLRIAVKKLRYGREFFASLELEGRHGKVRRRVDRALKRLQSALGDLNDMRVHAARTHSFAAVNAVSQKAFAAGFLTGREDACAAGVLQDALAAGKRLQRAA